jgi:uncharacterized protein (UPF0371 family)
MGVNMAGNCIFDDDACREASSQEIIRRYYTALCDLKKGKEVKDAVYKLELLMKKVGVSTNDRAVAVASLELEDKTGHPAAAIELPDGRIVTGKTTDLLGASAATLLNALKELANIPDEVHLISPEYIVPIQTLKTSYLGSQNPRLHTDEVLIALSTSAAHDASAKLALQQLKKLDGLEVHSSVMLSMADEQTFKKLGMHLTCEAKYETNRIYHKR